MASASAVCSVSEVGVSTAADSGATVVAGGDGADEHVLEKYHAVEQLAAMAAATVVVVAVVVVAGVGAL